MRYLSARWAESVTIAISVEKLGANGESSGSGMAVRRCVGQQPRQYGRTVLHCRESAQPIGGADNVAVLREVQNDAAGHAS